MRFNVSRLKSLAGCEAKYYYTYCSPVLGGEGFVKQKYPSEAADYGTAAHHVIEQVAKGANPHAAISEGQLLLVEKSQMYRELDEIEAADRVLKGKGGGTFPCKACDGTGLTPARKQPHKLCAGRGFTEREGIEGVEYLKKMMVAYLETSAHQENWGEVLTVEDDIEILLENGHTIVGRPDLIVRWNGRLWHINHKTVYASANFETLEKQYELDWHETAYQLMITQHFGEECVGSFIDFLRKTKEPSFHRIPLPRRRAVQERHLRDFVQLTDRGAYLASLSPEQAERELIHNTTRCVHFQKVCPYQGITAGTIDPLNADELVIQGYIPRVSDYVDLEDADE